MRKYVFDGPNAPAWATWYVLDIPRQVGDEISSEPLDKLEADADKAKARLVELEVERETRDFSTDPEAGNVLIAEMHECEGIIEQARYLRFVLDNLVERGVLTVHEDKPKKAKPAAPPQGEE